MHINRRRIFWGIIALCVAASVLSSLMGFFTWQEIQWRIWWPMIPATLTFALLASGHFNGWNFSVFAFSVWLLLCNTDVIPTDHGFLLAVAVFLAVMGFWLILTAIFPGLRRRRHKSFPPPAVEVSCAENSTAPGNRQYTVFEDASYVCTEPLFRHAKYSTVFGDVNVDLRSSAIADGALLEISCVFGDMNILVPAGCRVRLEGSHVFGQVKAGRFPEEEGFPLLVIRHSAVFGDVTVL
ncbi:MAG: cell wall-active antibiotics response protein [Clostridiales bacterium]|nr:cell wall-active antibiotics response protein [Clostridiales bacterium]